jgi:hypothetical protein
MRVQLQQALADPRLHSEEFICRVSGRSSWAVRASYAALSGWYLAGRELHATLATEAVPDSHWRATSFSTRPDTATLEVTLYPDDHEDHESFAAVVALTQAAA